MREVAAARLAEMDDEIARFHAEALEYLKRGEEGEEPKPPVFSLEEQIAWGEALQAKVTNRLIEAFGGKEAYEKLTGHSEAMQQALREADRSIAIVHVSVVEDQLRSAIEQFFPGRDSEPEVIDRLFNPMKYGPLGSFSARVDIAFALGIVGPGARMTLKKIAEIRNLFAHRLHINSFDNPEVMKLVDKLTYIDFAITGPDAEGLVTVWHRSPNNEGKSGHGYRAADNPFDTRGKFVETCQFLQTALRKIKPGIRHPDLHET